MFVRNASALFELLRRTRHRLRLHALLHKAALVLVPGLAAGALMFAFGADAIAWYWPFIAMLIAAGVVLFRGSRLETDDYTLARLLDRRLGLYDALSTALWFQNHDTVAWTSATVERQREFANRIAARADLRRALPFKPSRSSWWAGALALLMAGLFVARYGTLATLDLSRPLVPGAMTELLAAVFGRHPDRAKAASPERLRNSLPAEQASRRPENGISSGKGGGAGRSSDSAAAADGTETAETAQTKSTVDADGSGSPDGAPADASPSGGQSASDKAEDPSAAGGADPKTGGQNGSLIDRMRDAMAGLMSRLGLDQSSPSQSRDGARQNGAPTGRSGAQQKGEAKQPGNAQGAPQSAQDPNGMSAQSGGAAQQSRGNGADARTKSAEAQDANSGIGAQDGNKDAKMAAQLAAMGKLSEILGKRSQNVTGEVMVDTTSSGQQLSTPFSGRRSAHSDAGGEISRDQIPREYQQYVMQYFEQVHRLAAKHSAQQP